MMAKMDSTAPRLKYHLGLTTWESMIDDLRRKSIHKPWRECAHAGHFYPVLHAIPPCLYKAVLLDAELVGVHSQMCALATTYAF